MDKNAIDMMIHSIKNNESVYLNGYELTTAAEAYRRVQKGIVETTHDMRPKELYAVDAYFAEPLGYYIELETSMEGLKDFSSSDIEFIHTGKALMEAYKTINET